MRIKLFMDTAESFLVSWETLQMRPFLLCERYDVTVMRDVSKILYYILTTIDGSLIAFPPPAVMKKLLRTCIGPAR